MKMKLIVLLGLISLILASCDKPQRTPLVTDLPGPNQTWIDAPLTNSTLPLLPYNLIFHGASFVGITEFEVKINGSLVATVPPLSSGSGGPNYGTLFLGEYLWNPSIPGIYLISVRAKGNGQFSPLAQVQITIKGSKETDIPLEPIPTSTETQDELSQCIYTALINHFCRLGPGMGYEGVDNFVPDQSAPVIGQSTDGFFWYVTGPNYYEVCTVPKAERFGKTEGNCDQLTRFTPMPLPTPTYTPEPTACPAGVPCP